MTYTAYAVAQDETPTINGQVEEFSIAIKTGRASSMGAFVADAAALKAQGWNKVVLVQQDYVSAEVVAISD